MLRAGEVGQSNSQQPNTNLFLIGRVVSPLTNQNRQRGHQGMFVYSTQIVYCTDNSKSWMWPNAWVGYSALQSHFKCITNTVTPEMCILFG